MRCGRVSPLVDRYVDGALPPRVMARIESHAARCRRCAAEVAAARRLLGAFAAEPSLKAPRGFADRVMEAVYRQTPSAVEETSRAAAAPARGVVVLSPMYRRLGLSFVLTAAVLTASLFIPRAAYPSVFGGLKTGIEAGGAGVVAQAMARADTAVRGILGDQRTGGTP